MGICAGNPCQDRVTARVRVQDRVKIRVHVSVSDSCEVDREETGCFGMALKVSLWVRVSVGVDGDLSWEEPCRCGMLVLCAGVPCGAMRVSAYEGFEAETSVEGWGMEGQGVGSRVSLGCTMTRYV